MIVYGTALISNDTGNVLDIELENSLEAATALARGYNETTMAETWNKFHMIAVEIREAETND